jgi:hypothetical protein
MQNAMRPDWSSDNTQRRTEDCWKTTVVMIHNLVTASKAHRDRRRIAANGIDPTKGFQSSCERDYVTLLVAMCIYSSV